MILDEGPLHLRFHLQLDGRPLSVARDEYLRQLIARLDADGNGRLSLNERRQSPLFKARSRSFDNEFTASLEQQRTVTRRDLEQDLARLGGAPLIAYREDSSAAENDLEVFRILDADSSGRIDPGEMRTAVARIAELDSDRDECVDFSEFLPPPAEPAMAGVVPLATPDETPQITLSKLMKPAELPTIEGLVFRTYDRDRDRLLTPQELGWDEARVSHLDADGDGGLSITEIDDVSRWPIDLELRVNLSSDPATVGQTFVVGESASDRLMSTPRPDIARLRFGKTTVTLSYRHIDPLARALESAMLVFNETDLDVNGYLDREEIAGRFRFQRRLFDAMDADGDDKLFAEEYRSFVAVVCEPAGMTCHVNVYDAGQGFFQLLDNSDDGRISIRELRSIEASLVAAAGDEGRSLLPRNVGRHYHVEFTRGSYQLFGRAARILARGPEFIQRPAAGPAWFQGMDRNRDGDLTYDSIGPYGGEFLGPREDFDRLDADGDGLISIEEAARAEELFGPSVP
jgi:Ca2+-binding EF-hand superfamily protein